MKPISELLRIIKSIDAVDLSVGKRAVDRQFYELSGMVQNANYQVDDILDIIRDSYNRVSSEQKLITKTIADYKSFLREEIKKQEVDYYVKSDQIYYESRFDTTEYLLERHKDSVLLNNKEIYKMFASRLALYNRWEHPAIQIRPAFGNITDIIKGCDPLYLVDTDEAMFESVKQKWTQTYQRRLRYYIINETNEELLAHLPDEQYGLVLCVDYLNFRPMVVIKRYLREIYKKLKPGGTVMFTYNNCDLPYGARNVENSFCCYTPGKEVIKSAEEIGFELTKQFDTEENISWLELTKPGELKTIRGGQTLGEIISTGNSKEPPPPTKPDPNSPGEIWAKQNGSRLLRPK